MQEQCGDIEKGPIRASMPFRFRVTSRTAGSIQTSFPVVRAEEMVGYCFKRDTVSFSECESPPFQTQLNILLIANGKQPVVLRCFGDKWNISQRTVSRGLISFQGTYFMATIETLMDNRNVKIPRGSFLGENFHQERQISGGTRPGTLAFLHLEVKHSMVFNFRCFYIYEFVSTTDFK